MLAEQTNALAKFDITETAIAELKQKYGSMTIAGIDDKAGFQEVNRARITVKTKRIAIDKRRKELTEQARKWQDEVNAAGKKLMAPLIEIEAHLQAEEDKIEAEKERIRQEKIAAEQERIQHRVDILRNLGMVYKGHIYELPYNNTSITVSILNSCADEFFDNFVKYVSEAVEKEKARLAEIERQKAIDAELLEAQRLAESTRLEAVRKEQEAEQQRLDAIRRDQEAKEAELHAAQKKIDDEKAAIEAEKQRAEQERIRAIELEKAKQEAAKKAVEDERLRQEAQRAKEQQEKERAAAELARQEALRPDKEKLKTWARQIHELAINSPQIKDAILRDLVYQIVEKLEGVSNYLIQNTKELG